MISTMAKLFEVAGYKDYKSLPIGTFVKPKKNIRIASIEDNKKVFKDVTGLVYKGEATNGYKVISKKGIFLATEDHAIFNADTNKFEKLKDAFNRESFVGINDSGEKENIIIEKCNDSFSILDLEVEGTHSYFSGGILSHNSFGGSAKALGEFLKRIIILCANYDTNLLWISQERAPVGDMWAKVDKPTGGRMPGFAASIIIRTTKDDYIKIGDETIGMTIHARDYKNKCSVPFRDCIMTLYYDGGFNVDEEYIDYFDKLGFIQNNRGNYYSQYWEGCLKGGEKYKTWLKEHPDVYQELKEKTMEAFKSFNSILDAKNADYEKEIKEKKLENQDDYSPEELAEMALEDDETEED